MSERVQAIFDKLNSLKTEWSQTIETQGKLNREETEDTVLDLLIMAYVFGNTDANESLGTETNVNIRKMDASIYRKFEDRDFASRVAEYVRLNDLEGLVRVAETEMHRDYSAGVYDTAEDSGKQVYKTWETMKDLRVRENHWYLQSVSVPLEDKFYTIDGDSARYPGDFTLAENNVNCRCWLSVKTV